MKSFVAMSVVLMVAVSAASVEAQQRGGGFRFRRGITNLATLASNEAVQIEIGATDAQKEEIAKLRESIRGGFSGNRTNVQNLTPEEREKLTAEFRQRIEERKKKAREGLAKTLQPSQMERLEQISVQVQGAAALITPEISTKLKLSEEQLAKLKAVDNETRQGMQGVYQAANQQAARKILADLRKQSEEKALAVLSDEQKQQYTALKGKPFEFPLGVLGGRRRNNNNNN